MGELVPDVCSVALSGGGMDADEDDARRDQVRAEAVWVDLKGSRALRHTPNPDRRIAVVVGVAVYLAI